MLQATASSTRRWRTRATSTGASSRCSLRPRRMKSVRRPVRRRPRSISSTAMILSCLLDSENYELISGMEYLLQNSLLKSSLQSANRNKPNITIRCEDIASEPHLVSKGWLYNETDVYLSEDTCVPRGSSFWILKKVPTSKIYKFESAHQRTVYKIKGTLWY